MFQVWKILRKKFINSRKGCSKSNFLHFYYLIKCGNFIKKETLAQVFSIEFSEISKNTFFTEHLQETASLVIYVKQFFFYLSGWLLLPVIDILFLQLWTLLMLFSETNKKLHKFMCFTRPYKIDTDINQV